MVKHDEIDCDCDSMKLGILRTNTRKRQWIEAAIMNEFHVR